MGQKDIAVCTLKSIKYK